MSTGRLLRASREVVADTVRSLRGHDLLLYSAGLTFYALIGLVPLLLVATKVAAALLGSGYVTRVGAELGGYTGTSLGVDRAVVRIAASGTRLSLAAVIAILIPASLYSEGFVRAFDRLTRAGRRRTQSLRGRLLGPLLAVGTSLLLAAGFAVAGALVDALGDGRGQRLLGIYLGFLVAWALASLLLLLLYRVWSAERPSLRALVLGALSTGSFLAGMTLGFLLVLRAANGVGAVYAGSATLGAVSVVGFLLYMSHVVVLAGYGLTLRLDVRLCPGAGVCGDDPRHAHRAARRVEDPDGSDTDIDTSPGEAAAPRVLV